MTLQEIGAWLHLFLMPVWVAWAVLVLVPLMIAGNIRRWYQRPEVVRARALRAKKAKEDRFWAQYERDVAEILRVWGVIDTPANRAMYHSNITRALDRRNRKFRRPNRSQ